MLTAAYWKKLDAQAKAGMINRDSVGYYLKTSSTSGTTDATYSIVRKSIQRDADNKYAVTDEDGNIVFIHPSGQDGRTTILQKLAMAKEWLLKNYNYDLDKVRMGVQRRQWLTDANGNFVFDANGDFINNLTYTRADGTTVLDSLRQQVLKFKELQK